jgi:hypothetical protein
MAAMEVTSKVPCEASDSDYRSHHGPGLSKGVCCIAQTACELRRLLCALESNSSSGHLSAANAERFCRRTRSESRSPPRFEGRRAWIIRSENGGSSFSTPFLVSNDVCGPPPVFQLSALVADASEGPSRDRLYFACRQSGGPVVIVSRPGIEARPGTAPGSLLDQQRSTSVRGES